MKKIIKLILSVLVCVNLVTFNVFAATGLEGYAVYRDGVIPSWVPILGIQRLIWHAGMVVKPTLNYSEPIIHHSGQGYVDYSSFEDFVGEGNIYYGVFEPKSGTTSEDRRRVTVTTKALIGQEIEYTLLHHVYYPDNLAGGYITVNEIESMRCDGVVEYVYEWHYHRIYGDSSNWDVTKAVIANRDAHWGMNIMPQTQAWSYMDYVGYYEVD